jgi:hypothetical protein
MTSFGPSTRSAIYYEAGFPFVRHQITLGWGTRPFDYEPESLNTTPPGFDTKIKALKYNPLLHSIQNPEWRPRYLNDKSITIIVLPPGFLAFALAGSFSNHYFQNTFEQLLHCQLEFLKTFGGGSWEGVVKKDEKWSKPL